MQSSSWALIPKSQWGAPSVLQYRETRQVGKGTYGDVFLGEHITSKDTVALKKVSIKHNDAKHHHRGLPLNALREIRLLKSAKCQHPNIVRLLEVAADDNNNQEDNNKPLPFCYLVFEYVEHDLAGIIDSSVDMPIELIKCLIKQLLSALEHLHAENICHRDLKCSNLLVTSRNVLKLGDFGLARELKDDGRKLSLNVITLWYRPPEILLGDVRYTTSVDMWGVGCILVELFNRKPLFPGKKDETDQLKLIYGICGQPNERDCPRLVELPGFKPHSSNGSVGDLTEYFARKKMDADATNLALRLLEMEPTRRCTAKQALQSQFVNINCFAPHDLPPIAAKTSLHEWETKMKNKAAAAAAAIAAGAAEKLEQQQPAVAAAPAPLPPQDTLLRRASSSSRRRHQRRSRSPRRRY